MHILQRTIALILSVSLYSGLVSGNPSEQNVNFCNHIGGFAAGVSIDPSLHHLSDDQLALEARLIATKTAFEYNKTKGIIFEVARDPKMKNLTPAEFAGFSFFWCVYDLNQIPFGADAFSYQQDVINLYQTTLDRK